MALSSPNCFAPAVVVIIRMMIRKIGLGWQVEEFLVVSYIVVATWNALVRESKDAI